MLAAIASAVSALLGFLNRVGQYFAQQQLLNAGKAVEQVQVQQEVEEHVQKAEDAITVRDDKRTERLRKRFDQAYGDE